MIHPFLIPFHLRETVINASMLANDGDAEFEKSLSLRQLPVKSFADFGGLPQDGKLPHPCQFSLTSILGPRGIGDQCHI